jgi:hypothetical protein
MYPHLVACEGVGEDTERRYSACLRDISQDVLKEKKVSEIPRGNCTSINDLTDEEKERHNQFENENQN